MNVGEFNTEIGKTLTRAMAEGVTKNKLDIMSVVGVLEWYKADVVKWGQTQAALAQHAQMKNGIAKPGDRNFTLPN